MIKNNLLSIKLKNLINYLFKNKFLFFIITMPVKLLDILFIKKKIKFYFMVIKVDTLATLHPYLDTVY